MNKVIWLRVAFLWGMIADALEALRMSMPKMFLATTGFSVPNGSGLKFGLLYGVPVMLGWTSLLFWANQKPLERKGVAVCLLPVIGGYLLLEILAAYNGILSWGGLLLPAAAQTILIGLCLVGYFTTGDSTGPALKKGGRIA